MVHTKVVFEEGWSFIRGRKQCKPKHVSSGIVVLKVRWSLIRVVSQEGDYCTCKIETHLGEINFFQSLSMKNMPLTDINILCFYTACACTCRWLCVSGCMV